LSSEITFAASAQEPHRKLVWERLPFVQACHRTAPICGLGYRLWPTFKSKFIPNSRAWNSTPLWE